MSMLKKRISAFLLSLAMVAVPEFRLVMLQINGLFPFGCMAFPTN